MTDAIDIYARLAAASLRQAREQEEEEEEQDPPLSSQSTTTSGQNDEQTASLSVKIVRPRFNGYVNAPGIGNSVWDAVGDAVSKREKHLEVSLMDVIAKLETQLHVDKEEDKIEGESKEEERSKRVAAAAASSVPSMNLAKRLHTSHPDIDVPKTLQAIRTSILAHETDTHTPLVMPFSLALPTLSTRWISVRLDLRHMGSCFDGMRNAGILDKKWSGAFHDMMVDTVRELMQEFHGAWGFTQVGGTCAARSQALTHFPLPPRKLCCSAARAALKPTGGNKSVLNGQQPVDSRIPAI
jgi:hypothetical protein